MIAAPAMVALATRPDSMFQTEVDGVLRQAVDGVNAWPTHDLLASLP